jgi:spermidine/putrescine-binding protein
MTMLDDPAEVLGACLKLDGRSINATGEAELRQAQGLAVKQKPLLRAYLNAEVRDQMVAGDLAACHSWATTAQQAIDAAPALKFVYPAEGFPLYADCAVILRESRKADLAHRFIDFLTVAEVAADIVSHSRSATANGAARRILPTADSALETLYPAAKTLERGEWFATMPPPAQRLRDRIWTEIKSS